MEKSGTTGQGRRLAARGQSLIACFASAVLYILAFPPFDLPEAAYVFAVPLFLNALFTNKLKGEGIQLFIAGWFAWTVLIFWLRNVTSHLEGFMAGVLGWIAVLGLAAILALFWTGWAMIAVRMARAVRNRGLAARLLCMVLLPGLWVVLEWIRGTLFTGFPWLPLAASQWERPLLLQIASITGAAGISYVLITFNTGLSFYLHGLWRNRKERWWRRLSPEFYLALFFLFSAIAFGLHTSGAGNRGWIDGPRMGLVQPDVPAIDKWDPALAGENLAVLEDLTTYAGYLGAELVLWPESPTPLPVKGNAFMRDWVESLSARTGLPFLIGNLAAEEGEGESGFVWFNAVFMVDPQAGLTTEPYYAKRHLVPFGEYVPFARFLPFLRTVVPIEVDMAAGRSADSLPVPLAANPPGEAGILICYEDIFPGLARQNTLAGADWHYVVTNNGWFGEEGGAYQHAAHSVLRAVETRRPVVRCGNAGWSGWIDEFGHIRHLMVDETNSIYFQGVDTFEFKRNRWWANRLSTYAKWGDWFTLVCVLLTAGTTFIMRAYGRKM